MNRVMLVGRITRDPELRTSPNGVSFTAFSIAVNRQFANAQGERVADFMNWVAFNKQAENLDRFMRKGGLIGVEGKLQTRRYQATDGSNRTATEVICDMVHFLENRNTQTTTNSFSDYSSYEPRQTNNYQQPVKPNNVVQSDNPFDDLKNQFDISDDDLPF